MVSEKKVKLVQVGVDKFTRKPIYEELTYDFFIKHIGWEWVFYYNKNLIEISIADSNNHKGDFIYSLAINSSNSNGSIQEFTSEQDFIADAKIFGKSLKDIWDELDYYG